MYSYLVLDYFEKIDNVYLSLFGRIEHNYFRFDWRGSVGLLILDGSEISDISDRRIELDRSVCDLGFFRGHLKARVQVRARIDGGR